MLALEEVGSSLTRVKKGEDDARRRLLIGSHPHRFVRIGRCVMDRGAVERGDLFPGMISPKNDDSRT